jgi:hypothetical protein
MVASVELHNETTAVVVEVCAPKKSTLRVMKRPLHLRAR